MTTKKKFIIALCSVGVVAIAAIATLIGVLAAFNAKTTEGGFVISYSAKNVKATIAAEYYIDEDAKTTIKTTDGQDLITFTGEETDEKVEKSFAKVENIALGKTEVLTIHYTITNTDSVGGSTFKVIGSYSEVSAADNLTIKYSTDEDAAAEDWKDSLTEIANVDSVEAGTPLNLYVRISVTTPTKSASFNGAFNFELTVNG